MDIISNTGNPISADEHVLKWDNLLWAEIQKSSEYKIQAGQHFIVRQIWILVLTHIQFCQNMLWNKLVQTPCTGNFTPLTAFGCI